MFSSFYVLQNLWNCGKVLKNEKFVFTQKTFVKSIYGKKSFFFHELPWFHGNLQEIMRANSGNYRILLPPFNFIAEIPWKYRKDCIRSRGFYSFQKGLTAASIQVSLVFEGGFYYKFTKNCVKLHPKMHIFKQNWPFLALKQLNILCRCGFYLRAASIIN